MKKIICLILLFSAVLCAGAQSDDVYKVGGDTKGKVVRPKKESRDTKTYVVKEDAKSMLLGDVYFRNHDYGFVAGVCGTALIGIGAGLIANAASMDEGSSKKDGRMVAGVVVAVGGVALDIYSATCYYRKGKAIRAGLNSLKIEL